MAQYSTFSPYSKVKQTWYLGYYSPRGLLPADSDTMYTIETKYNEQPWRLAKERFGNERLYYIFALLNPNIIEDPVYDFKAGVTIRIPTMKRIKEYLDSSRSTR